MSQFANLRSKNFVCNFSRIATDCFYKARIHDIWKEEHKSGDDSKREIVKLNLDLTDGKSKLFAKPFLTYSENIGSPWYRFVKFLFGVDGMVNVSSDDFKGLEFQVQFAEVGNGFPMFAVKHHDTGEVVFLRKPQFDPHSEE